MPALPSSDILHNAATDHRIPRRPGEAPRERPTSEAKETLRLFHEGLLATDEERADVRRARGIALAEKLMRPTTPRQRQDTAREALVLLSQAIDATSGDAAAARAESFILDEVGRRADAFTLLMNALETSPRHEGLLENAAADALNLRRAADAVSLAQRLVAINPSSADHQSLLAEACAQSHQWPAALAAAREALRLDPSHPNARSVLVDVYLQTGQPSRARREAETLQILDPAQRP
jgi:tetratricopeptide (TPR) repeat protein